ncbi:hypothetical protein C6P46_003393 [Rhodotorula mucilaginosa]|uniref:Uncharacterized protein n=1 Tax=Rhodotorula mucilaginosa TaxID=5537 RepID=A0A9P6VSV9_RHOMI|nr:hypothetical protein C6P46_003393 [Rhodotorula mucilaginosa]
MAAPESEKREIPPPPPSTIKKLPRYPKGLAGAREIRTPEGVAQRQTSVKGVHSPYPEQAFPTDSSRFQLPHAKGFCRANLALSSLLQTVIHSSAFRLVIQRASHGSASDDRVPGPDTRFLVHQHPGPLLRDRNGSTSIKSGSLRSVQAQRGPEEKAKMRPNNMHALHERPVSDYLSQGNGRRRRDEEIFPRRRRLDPVPSSFPQIPRRRRRPFFQPPTWQQHAWLLDPAPPLFLSARLHLWFGVDSSRLETATSPRRARLGSSSALFRGAPTRAQQKGKMLLYNDVQWQWTGELRTGANSGSLAICGEEFNANEQVVTLAAFRAARASPGFSYLDCPCTFRPEVKVACERCSDFRAGLASVMDFFSSAVLIGAPKEGTHFAWSTRFGQSSEPEQE